jgi:hypothetical protein
VPASPGAALATLAAWGTFATWESLVPWEDPAAWGDFIGGANAQLGVANGVA